MGWLNGKETPVDPANVDSVVDPNKPPDKTQAELIADALRPFGDQFTALNTRLAQIEENSKKPEPKLEPRTITSVYEDEDQAFQQRLTPVVLRQLELEARMVTGDIKREYEAAGFGDMWNQYATDINGVLEGSPLVTAEGKPLRGNPDYIRNTVDMVLGRAARTKGLRFNGKEQTFFLESAGGTSNGGNTATNDGLTDAQRKVFARMKIDPAQGKATLDKLQFIN